MTSLETNHHAERLLAYLMTASEAPLDGVAILGLTLLKIYDSSTNPSGYTLERFAEDFKKSMLESYQQKSNTGSVSLQ